MLSHALESAAYEPSELVVTVQGRHADRWNWKPCWPQSKASTWPFEPPRFMGSERGRGTVGGMVAAGLSGPGPRHAWARCGTTCWA